MLSGDSLQDDGGAIVSASRWLEGVLLGNLATAIAILAVAGVGLLMLTGRVDLRRGATVVIGCFIVFGASSIASALQSVVQDSSTASVSQMPPAPVASPVTPPPVPALSDPYAGASVPQNR